MERFWKASAGAFVNGLDENGELDPNLSVFAQIWGIMLDLVEPRFWGRMVDEIFANPALRSGNVSFQAAFEYVAAAKADRIYFVLERLRTVWGSVLERGLTRFPEDINPAESHSESLVFYGRPFGRSLCHAWAGAAPIIALSKGVLGVEAVSPGWRECAFTPRLGDLEWARGAVPTPHGLVEVELQKGRPARLSLPKGIAQQ
jgi:alpha-L-rhamnosidase